MAEDLPAERPADLPAEAQPRLTPAEMEAVIARAIELQAREEEREVEGIGASELVRIATELGLSPAHVQQAIAEVRGRPPSEGGLLTALAGGSRVTASRMVRMPAGEAREQLDRYLREREAMVVQRRLPDRTVYVRGTGVGAAVTRAAGMVAGSGHPLLNLASLEVTVNPADAGTCFVALSVDLGSLRAGTAAGTAAGALAGSVGAAVAGVVLAPPVALVGIPVIAGFAWMMRASYRHTLARTQTQLESLLDRLEHDELVVRGPGPNLLRRFGL